MMEGVVHSFDKEKRVGIILSENGQKFFFDGRDYCCWSEKECFATKQVKIGSHVMFLVDFSNGELLAKHFIYRKVIVKK